MCEGKEQKEAYQTQKDQTAVVMGAYQKVFAQNDAILKSISTHLDPIINAGIGQFGMTPEEEAAQRNDVNEQFSKAGSNASVALENQMASRGGGTEFLPSGTDMQLRANLLTNEESARADAQRQITEKGYDLGRQNFWQATQALAAVPGQLQAPVNAAANTMLGGGSNQSAEANAIQASKSSWMAPVMGMVGGIAGGAATAGLAKAPVTNIKTGY